MRVQIDAPESLPGLYDVRLYVLGGEGRRGQAERVLYLPDIPGECPSHKCDPLPSVTRVGNYVRGKFGMAKDDGLLNILAESEVPRFDAYDELYGFAYALGLIVPLLDARRIERIGEQECNEHANDEFLALAKELEPFRARSYVVGGQRRMACELTKGKSFKNRPLEWLCVSEQRRISE